MKEACIGYSDYHEHEHQFGNAGPLGLAAFALTTLVLSFYNCAADNIHTPNVVIGLAVFYGGFVQLLAGMWEIVTNHTFNALALSSYAGFWLSYAAIFIPWFNISASYDTTAELDHAIGFFLLAWCIFTYGLCLLTIKTTWAFFGLFFMLGHTFLLLCIGAFAQSDPCNRAGGVLGIVTAFIAWYNAYASVATRRNTYFKAANPSMPIWGEDPEKAT